MWGRSYLTGGSSSRRQSGRSFRAEEGNVVCFDDEEAFDMVCFSGRKGPNNVATDGGRFGSAREGSFLCESLVRCREVADVAGDAM